MKYLMTYESMTNCKVEVLTSEEFRKLYHKIYPNGIDLKDKIHYFNWGDLNQYSSNNEKHFETLRFITAYNKKDILGVCLFAWWDSGEHYSTSYVSTNKDYLNMGISKKLLEKLFEYFSKIYPNEILYCSGYSIDGWKWIHNTKLELSKKYNVKIREKGIEFVVGKWDDEKRELFDKSREEIKKLYPDYYDMLGYM